MQFWGSFSQSVTQRNLSHDIQPTEKRQNRGLIETTRVSIDANTREVKTNSGNYEGRDDQAYKGN